MKQWVTIIILAVSVVAFSGCMETKEKLNTDTPIRVEVGTLMIRSPIM